MKPGSSQGFLQRFPAVSRISVKRILAVINATYAVAKRKPEKNQACRDSNPDLCDTGAALYRRGQGSNPGKPDFFRLSFLNCISCVNNCEDPLYTYFFIVQFKYMNFMYS